MDLRIEADLTQTLCVRKMHKLIEINIFEGKKFTCLFINKEQAEQVINKLNECVGECYTEERGLSKHAVMHLLPCPFCGSEPFIDRREAAYIVMCPNCLTVQTTAIDKEIAIQRWNKRQ